MSGLVDAWEENAAAWHAFVESPGAIQHRMLLDAVLHHAGDVAGQVVLDAGCGDGVLTRQLRARGAHTVGLDFAAANVVIARRLDPEGEYLVADLSACPCGVGVFDLVVANMVLHSVSCPELAFAALRRALKTHGRLLMTIYHPCFTAPGSGWGRSTVTEAPVFRIEGYRQERCVDDVLWGPGGPFPCPVPHVHRPLGSWFSLLAGAGFGLTTLRELPDARDGRAEPPDVAAYADIPVFLLLEAVPRGVVLEG